MYMSVVSGRDPRGLTPIEARARARLIEDHHDPCGNQGANYGAAEGIGLYS